MYVISLAKYLIIQNIEIRVGFLRCQPIVGWLTAQKSFLPFSNKVTCRVTLLHKLDFFIFFLYCKIILFQTKYLNYLHF